jgi:hypothetical protein
MDTHSWLATFGASFVFVGLKATQQLHVTSGQYLRVIPTSLAMACTEVFIVASVARNGWGWMVLPVGLGAGLGCCAAMWLHRRTTRA